MSPSFGPTRILIFPRKIVLGAADDLALVEKIGRITTLEMAAIGIYWDFALLVSFRRTSALSEGACGISQKCLELHDLWVSKAIAGRPKDREFCRALLDAGYVDRVTLTARLSAVADLDTAIVRSVEDMIRA